MLKACRRPIIVACDKKEKEEGEERVRKRKRENHVSE